MRFVKSLGKGTYGSVDLFSYTNHDGSTLYNAVKISDHQSYDSIDREFRILSELRGCSGIVQSFGDSLLEETDSDGNRVYKMSMEYAASGTLTSFIQRNKKLSDSIIKDFTRMILRGLVSVHSHGYVHCDLKPDNILLFPRYEEETWYCSYELKISDFGLSIKAGEKSHCWTKDSPFVGTPLYMSAESVHDGTTVEKTLDLWSLGCIVLEMYTGKNQWSGFSVDDMIKPLLLDGKAPEIPETVPCVARQFMEKCFARQPEERGSASELLLHPFLIGDQKMAGGSGGGERRRVGLRIRKPPSRLEDVTKTALKLKIVSSKPSQFKKISNKPLKVKFLPPRPPRSNFVPVQ
ncbi:mitogen-activated protein kinase kinase kinase 17 [Eutrema salsugineum]|nr:mitogen-activated protein kinase kinase kinase 17 [Eutrema salsugineum]